MKKNLFLVFSLLFFGIGKAQTNRVGVNTDKPQAVLDVNGNMAIKADRATDDDNLYDQLFWDSKTKKISFSKNDGVLDNSPFHSVKYRIKCFGTVFDPEKGDLIEDFDTKIDANKFLMIITHVNPVSDDNNNWLGVRHTESSNQYTQRFTGVGAYTTGSGTGSSYYNDEINPVREVRSFIKDNTWHFFIDYPAARPPKDRNVDYVVTWEVSTLVIDKSLIRELNYGEREIKNAEGKMFDNKNELK